MDLRLTETQEMFRKVAGDFVKAEAPPTSITDWYIKKETAQLGLYRKAAGLGWVGMTLPEKYGGASGSYTDCAVVFEQMGHAPLPGPFFSSGVLGSLIVFHGGSESQKNSLLPAICNGESIAIPAITDRGAHWGPQAVSTRLIQTQNEFVLEGTKRFVLDAEAATLFICAARTDTGDIAIVLVDPKVRGVTVTSHQGFIASTAEVRFDQVRIKRSELLGEPVQGWHSLEQALVEAIPVLCAYQVGACQEIFEFTAEYTRSRVVFGQPIGRFQRVQDHCVDLSIHLDAARYITYETLWKVDSGLPALSSVHEAKAVASEAYYQVCNFAHMVFAGPGTDYRHPLMAHSVMAHTLYQYLGTPLQHKHQMMDALYPVANDKSSRDHATR